MYTMGRAPQAGGVPCGYINRSSLGSERIDIPPITHWQTTFKNMIQTKKQDIDFVKLKGYQNNTKNETHGLLK
jgi:hypothetical protein